MSESEDKTAIRELIDLWAVSGDSGDLESFKTVWHDDGCMSTTWFEGTADEFIEMKRQGWTKGVSILHLLGGSTIDVKGNRAIAQTKMQILQRGKINAVECDVVCTGRFYDFFEKRGNRWGLVFRQPIYEKDRIDPVDSSQRIELDQAVLNSFPEGYRHLAYLQKMLGFKFKGENRPGLKGPEVERLYARGKRWLERGPLKD